MSKSEVTRLVVWSACGQASARHKYEMSRWRRTRTALSPSTSKARAPGRTKSRTAAAARRAPVLSYSARLRSDTSCDRRPVRSEVVVGSLSSRGEI